MQKLIQRIIDLVDMDSIILTFLSAVPKYFVAGMTLLFFYFLWKVVEKGLKLFIDKSKMDLTGAEFISTVVKYTLFTIGFVTALSQIGINIASILTSLGILGLTIGFAAKDALSNIISGLFIFWDRPFVLNDLIEIEGYYGRVEQITLRSTRIITVDGKMLAIPNNTVVNQIVASYTNFPNLRIDTEVTVGVNENIARVRKILLSITENNEEYLQTPPPEMVVESLNDYNVTLKLRVWIKDERSHIRLKYQLRENVFNTLTKEGVDMPYETIQLAPFKTEMKSVS